MKSVMVLFMMAFLFCSLLGSGECKPYPFLIEIVVVFKKGVAEARAREILKKLDYPHREGMDSSKDKLYFYKTGPKFILHVPRDEQEAVMKRIRALPEVYEVYLPVWKIQKD